jgi:hypothetical protein
MKRFSLHVMTALALAGCSQAGPTTTTQGNALAASEASAFGVAVAQGDRAQFKALDANGDQALSPSELPLVGADAFKTLDLDGDGKLTFLESTSQAADAKARAEATAEFAKAAKGEGVELQDAPVQAMAKARVGNPVILVPGYLDLPAFFIPITKKLRSQGRDVTFLNLFPNISDIRKESEILKKKVAEIKARTGASQVDIIGHSMGGLISRYYIKNLNGEKDVARLIQLATPNHGTIVSHLSPTDGAQQMHTGSADLNALKEGDENPGEIDYTSIRGGLDEIVIPHDSPILEGADNQFCRFAAHGSFFVDPSAWEVLDTASRR